MSITRVSVTEGRKLLQTASARQKYHAQPTTVDGLHFDSRGESERYGILKILQRAKQIRDLAHHVRFTLHACDLATGELTAIGDYECDFSYIVVATNEPVVEDWKGMATLPMAKWKMRHLKAEYGITVQEVRRGGAALARPKGDRTVETPRSQNTTRQPLRRRRTSTTPHHPSR